MKRYFSVGLMVLGLSSFAFGVDYTKMSNNELIGENGKFNPKNTIEYFEEISKRIAKMSKEELRDFRIQFRETKWKNEENMLVKDWRNRNKEICQELNKVQKQDRFFNRMAKIYCKSFKKTRRFQPKEG